MSLDKHIATWGRPARLSDFTVDLDYRYLDLPPGEYAYQEDIPVKRLMRSRPVIKIPTTATALKSEIETRTDSEVNRRPTTAVRTTSGKHFHMGTSSMPVGATAKSEPDIIQSIKQRSGFHNGGSSDDIYKSLYGW